MQKLRGNFFVNSYVKSKWLTHDPERMASFDTDPLIARAISESAATVVTAAAVSAAGLTIPTATISTAGLI